MTGWYVWVFVAFFLPALLVWGGVWLLSRRLSLVPRIVLLVVSATLLLTPSWGPATIVVIPVPFGLLFGLALISGAWSEVIGMVSLFPIWHLVAFPATATVFYVVVRLLLSNQAFNPTSSPPLRGVKDAG